MGKAQMSRRRFLQALGMAGAAGLIASCTPEVVTEIVEKTVEVEKVVEKTVEVEKEVEKVVEVTAVPSGPAHITYWLPPTTEQVYREQMINEFMLLNSDITVEMDGADPANYNEATQLLFKGGDFPDVFWKFNLSFSQMLAEDLIQPFPQAAQDYLMSAYPESMFLEGINMWEGKLYGFWPVGPKSATRVLYTNDQLFAAAGIEVPTTWSELVDAAQALTDAGAGQSYGLIMGGLSTWDYTALVGGLAMTAGKMAAADGEANCIDWTKAEMTIASDYMVEGLKVCVDMMDAGTLFPGFTTINHTEARAGLATNWAGMYVGGWWDAGAYKTQFPDFKFSASPLPVFDGGKLGFNHGAPFIDRVYVSKQAEDLDAVAQFLIYKFGPAYQRGWARNGWFTALPEANEASNIADPIVQNIFRISEDIRAVPDPVARNNEQAAVSAERKAITPNWGDILGGVFSGQIAPDDYATEAQAYADLWRAELERAITEVAGRGANVSLDDWMFPNWDPDSDYTTDMYADLA